MQTKAPWLAAVVGLLAFPAITPALTLAGGAVKVGMMDAFSQQVAVGAGGEFVVAWTRSHGGSLPQGAFARIYLATGAPQSAEIRLNARLRDFPTYVSVAVLDDGSFVAVYNSKLTPKALFARRFNPRGRPSGGVVSLPLPDLDTVETPDAGILGDGSFAVAYATPSGTVVRSFDSGGQLRGQEVSLSSAVFRPLFAVRQDGALLAIWSLASGEVWSQLIERDGTTAGAFALNDPLPPSGASLVGFGGAPSGDGGFIVTWSVLAAAQSSFLSHIAPDGSPVGPPSLLADAGAGGGTLAAAAGDGFISVWAEWVQPPPSGGGQECAVLARQFDAGDEALGQPVGLVAQPYLCSPTVAGNGGKDFVAAWMGLGNGSFTEPYVALLVRRFHAD